MSSNTFYDFSSILKSSGMSATIERVREMQQAMIPDSVIILQEQIRQMQESFSSPITNAVNEISTNFMKPIQLPLSDSLKETIQQLQKLTAIYARNFKFNFNVSPSAFENIEFESDTVAISYELVDLVTEISDASEDMFPSSNDEGSRRLISKEVFIAFIFPLLLLFLEKTWDTYVQHQDSIGIECQHQKLLEKQEELVIFEEQQLLEIQKQTKLLEESLRYISPDTPTEKQDKP